jgi:hypothetical protein
MLLFPSWVNPGLGTFSNSRRPAALFLMFSFLFMNGCAHWGVQKGDKCCCRQAIFLSPEATNMEKLAALEIRRYIYLRTDQILPIVEKEGEIPSRMRGVLVAQKDSASLSSLSLDRETLQILGSLQSQEYMIKTINNNEKRIVLVAGGDAAGTLYGAYRFVEHLGVRFYLDGDVIPDKKIPLEFPELDEQGKPLFALRGIQPFHDFAEGPDWWNEDDYKAVIAQLPKLGMNFIGLHTYPEKAPHAEPTVWIGLPEDVLPDGQVRFSYQSTYMNTIRADIVPGNWGYESKKTGDFLFGTDQLFDRDAFGSDVMNNHFPGPNTPESCNDVFNRTGAMLRNAFEWAHALGVKTCVGTETKLTIPDAVKERVKATGRSPDDPAVLKEVYQGIFTRIMKAYPIDFYWMWTNEGWTWQGISPETCDAVIKDMLTACEAASSVKVPFRLATCGWVLGPQYDRSYFDRVLPRDMAISCINRQVGFTPVDKGFANVQARDKWAIPWLEDDPALTAPQLWVARMRRDAGDALDYGCTGLMGIHWRTGIIGPNIAALAQAAWNQSPWKEEWNGRKQVEIKPGPLSGKYANYPNNPIDGTDDDPLYQTVRWDVAGYRFPLPSGSFQVTLKFCDPHYDKPGKRVFNTLIQGDRLIKDLDIVARAGKNVALDFEFKDIQVKDGWLKIDFEYVVEFPCIAAIVIQGKDYTEKINCGGPAYKDYKADWPANELGGVLPGTGDFYLDWALHQFGSEAASEIAGIFEKIDGKLPRPLDWIDGPGGLVPDSRQWEEVTKEYGFVYEMAALRSMIKGKGNLHRFDYWLHQFQYLKSAAALRCAWFKFEQIMAPIKPEKADPNKPMITDPEQCKKIGQEQALPLYIRMIGYMKDMEEHLLATTSNIGEMGTIANIEQHSVPRIITRAGKRLEQALGAPLSSGAQPSKKYAAPPRIFIPTNRTSVLQGEKLSLKVIVLSRELPSSVKILWRPLGAEKFQTIPAQLINRGVYSALLPEEALETDTFEYYAEAITPEGNVQWPVTAPEICRSVVVMPFQ